MDSKINLIEKAVIFKNIKDICIITLNRPKASNSFDLEIIYSILDKFQFWKEQKCFPKQVILKSDHPVVFSAGGDIIKTLLITKSGGSVDEICYPMKRQFELDFKISQLKKAGVKTFALLNGVVMGQGVGFIIPTDFRIACENTMLAMPESRIGMFADIGVSYYFSRLKYEVGRHMAILGYRLRESRVFFSKIANCFVQSEKFSELEQEIIEMGEQSPLLKQGMNYQVEDVEEGLEWVGYACICQEIMKKTRKNVRGLVDVHQQLLHHLEETQQPILSIDFKEFNHIFKPEILKSEFSLI